MLIVFHLQAQTAAFNGAKATALPEGPCGYLAPFHEAQRKWLRVVRDRPLEDLHSFARFEKYETEGLM